jgi:predicted glycogen debranching enzyme
MSMDAMTLLIPWLTSESERPEPGPAEEWLVTNGLGGFAAGALSGPPTRRYHGLLIAASHVPLGRFMMLNHLAERLTLADGRSVDFARDLQAAAAPPGKSPDVGGLAEFRLELGLPRWRFQLDDYILERYILMPREQNTVLVRYHLLGGKEAVRLQLRPLVHFRRFSDPVTGLHDTAGYRLEPKKVGNEIHGPNDPTPLRLRFAETPATFDASPQEDNIFYALERTRGYSDRGMLWSPGTFSVELKQGMATTLLASAEIWSAFAALEPADAFAAERERRLSLLAQADPRTAAPDAAQLVLAADQFLAKPVLHREMDSAQIADSTTIMAGYYWFTDWGRDTMISLEGLTLLTGRHKDAREILLTFAKWIRDGLVPDLFPEGDKDAQYNTADASLWFCHALARYLDITADRTLLQELLPKVKEIVSSYRRGTKFGIGMDPADSLIHEGDPDFALTWMDAKVGDWIVTPRRGKAVEINALWYNTLRLVQGWLHAEGDTAGAEEIGALAAKVQVSFNGRFWHKDGGYLFDVVDGPDGDDARCRPNQIFSIALRYPVLDPCHWQAVFDVVRERLLTPVGLRSLAPGSPDYQPVYFGARHARDGSYHQGTVWPWLLGPYLDAWLRVHPDDRRVAHQFLVGIAQNLGRSCVGTLNEIFDAHAPYTPRGCVGQAWSVAEVLRAWVQTTGD